MFKDFKIRQKLKICKFNKLFFKNIFKDFYLTKKISNTKNEKVDR